MNYLSFINDFYKNKNIDEEILKESNEFSSCEDLCLFLSKNNIDTEYLFFENITEINNKSLFFAFKIENEKLKFNLFLKNNGKIYLINEFNKKILISENVLKEKYINQIIYLKNNNQNSQNKNILFDFKILQILIIVFSQLLINMISIFSGLFLTVLTKFVIQQNSTNNFWWILICFGISFIIKVLLSNFLNIFIKKILKDKFYKWYSITWDNILKKDKSFFCNQTNLFIINDYLMNIIKFNTYSIAEINVNIITLIGCSIFLFLINFWFFFSAIILSSILVVFSIIKKKNQSTIFEQNTEYDNNEKNLVTLMYQLKNSYYNTTFFNKWKTLLNQATINNYEFNLSYNIKNERLDILNSIIINIFNTILLILIIVNNVNNPENISNYFFIIAINNTFINSVNCLYNNAIQYPLIKIQNNFLKNINVNVYSKTIGIKITSIQDIEFENLSFKHVSINKPIKITDSICLVGPSGCGKTHFLWSIVNNTENIKTHVKINNLKVENIDQTSLKNMIIYLKADTPLISHQFQELIEMEEFKEIVTNFLKISNLNIYDILNNCLSSGQKQMINVLNLLKIKNKLLLLDEITSNIDQQMIIFFNQNVFPIIRKNNLVINVSHNPLIINEYKEILNLYEFI